MHLIEATLIALRIPFAEAFAHSVKTRTYSDSIVVRLQFADGTLGYGEAVARPYVTGETVDATLAYMAEIIWPALATVDYDPLPPDPSLAWLSQLAATIPSAASSPGVVAWNAAKAGFELALVDGLCKASGRSLGALLRPQRPAVTYSGVITASSPEKAVKTAQYFQRFGLAQIKVKVTGERDQERLAAIRETVGPGVSLRIDGNGAYDLETAIATCQALEPYQIDSAEQLLPRGNLARVAALAAQTAIPQMADESLITLADAQDLIATPGFKAFNLRLSKCGGLAQTIAIAQLAQAAGIKLQVGCQVGETAILSAAGRHLAAWLPEIAFAEGSYGTLLLSEDISRHNLHFGHRGLGKVLRHPGLGIEVDDAVLQRYAHRIVRLKTLAGVG